MSDDDDDGIIIIIIIFARINGVNVIVQLLFYTGM